MTLEDYKRKLRFIILQNYRDEVDKLTNDQVFGLFCFAHSRPNFVVLDKVGQTTLSGGWFLNPCTETDELSEQIWNSDVYDQGFPADYCKAVYIDRPTAHDLAEALCEIQSSDLQK